MDCSGLHRSLGVHVSFVRSTNMDTWTQEQLTTMKLGGNGRARLFFKQHGWDGTVEKTEEKYSSRAAVLYRQQLARETAAEMAKGGASKSPTAASGAAPAEDADDFFGGEMRRSAPPPSSTTAESAPESTASAKTPAAEDPAPAPAPEAPKRPLGRHLTSA